MKQTDDLGDALVEFKRVVGVEITRALLPLVKWLSKKLTVRE